jgi:hypothetical protein
MVTVAAMMDLRDDDVRQCGTGACIGCDRANEAEPAIGPHAAQVPGVAIAASLLLHADEVIE